MPAKPRKATTRPVTVSKTAVGTPGDHLAPTPASGWKKSGAVLQLPSGNVMRLKNPGIMELAHQGLIPNSLMSTIMDSIAKGKTDLKPEEMLVNLEVSDLFDMMSGAIISMAVEPEVHPVPEPGDPRDPELVYIDDISEEDQLFIWQWATGGTTDVEQFRRERASELAALPGRKALG